MVWGSEESSTALTLSGSYQVVQRSSADWEVTLNPGETAQIQMDFNPEAAPTENCLVGIYAATDGGTDFDTDDSPIMAMLLENSSDPNRRTINLRGLHTFRFSAKLMDTDGTPGGDDTASTLTVNVRKDGVSL